MYGREAVRVQSGSTCYRVTYVNIPGSVGTKCTRLIGSHMHLNDLNQCTCPNRKIVMLRESTIPVSRRLSC
jgi:hypothetical protein